MKHNPWLWLILLACGMAACGHASGPKCGPGTELKDGKCVAVAQIDACGAGTVQDGGVCVLQADAGGEVGADAEGPDAADAAVATCSPACANGHFCNADGLCQPLPLPASWTCSKTAWADGVACDCGCGAFDPDCADATRPVTGCAGTSCNADGTCPACTAQCSGKVCGDDGCGGSCGVCQDPKLPVCLGGQCSACVPQCSGKACGDDGCGGSCGSCAAGKLCAGGQCGFPPAELSCVGHCGGIAPGGCSCQAECSKGGTCCVDVGSCGCLPKCGGKTCGDDGCGGTCGVCAPGAICTDGTCSIGLCTADTCGNHGACSGNGCVCDAGFAGAFCDECAVGYVNFPSCVTACVDDFACSDGNECTADECSATLGCVHLPGPVTCSDGDPCSQGDTCVSGTCQATGTCDDSDPCTTDACDPAVGCSHLPAAATVCDDGNACTSGDTCAAGLCAGATATKCDDGNACSDDGCSPATGCSHVGTAATCDDGNPCSAGGVCQGVTCTSAAPKSCDDGNACTLDACATATGACSHLPASATTACDDDDLCTSGDTCDGSGKCAGGQKICALSVTQGLVAHYSAGQPSTLAYGSDLTVAGWQDQSGQAHHLQAIDGQKAPSLVESAIHGRRGVRVEGAGLITAPFEVGSGVSVAAVLCTETSTSVGAMVSQGGWSLAGTAAQVTWSSGGTGASATGIAPGTCYVFAGRVGGGSLDLARVTTTTTDQSGSGTVSPGQAALQIGGTAATGVLGELLVYDHALSDDDRDSVLTYLRTAWGFSPPKPDFAWFDAADLASVVTASDPSGAVLQWKDKSGLDRHASSGNSQAPTWYASGTSNGQPALRFDGVQVGLQTEAVPSSPQMTVFAVFELDKPQTSGLVFGQGQDAYFALGKEQSVPGTLHWRIAQDSATAKLPYTSGAWQVATAVQDGTASLFYADPQAVQQAMQAAAIPAGSAALSLGNAAAGGQSMGGFLAEIQAFATPLSRTDRAFIESGLRVKYGL